ncbi:MAG: polysaccharide deacetylase family protein [Gaiellaceae bacterium]
MISAYAEPRARWVLDTLGARELAVGEEVRYDAGAWAQVERGERPEGDELAGAFWHLARLEERSGERDRHGRFPSSASALDPLDPPLERLRARLGIEPPRWRGARFAVALTHDVDRPWRWTGRGVRNAVGRLAARARAGAGRDALREARGLAAVPVHRLRGSDPNWCFARIAELEGARGSSSTHFLLAGHGHVEDGFAPEVYDRLRPRLVETLLETGAEVGLHGSYLSAEEPLRLAAEKEELESRAGPGAGQRYHFLRVDPHANLAPLAGLGFQYDTTLGFADAPGFRAGITQPFRPWSEELGHPLPLVEIPLALMDTTLAVPQYLGLTAAQAEGRALALLDRAAELGGGFAILWHTNRFDPPTAAGWDRLYERILDGVLERGGVCLTAGELAAEAGEVLLTLE